MRRAVLNIIFFFFASLILAAGFFSNINTAMTNRLYGGRTASQDIVIAAIDDPSLQEIGRWPWERKVFAALVDNLSCAKIIGIDVGFFEKSADDKILGSALTEKTVIAAEYSGFSREGESVKGKDLLMPVQELQGKASVGYINILTDSDGVSRAINPNVKGNISHFSQMIAEKYLGRDLPYDKNRFMVNYVGAPGSFRYVPIKNILKDGCSGLEGKIVLVGATSQDLHDELDTPTVRGKLMPGVEVHANTIQSFMEGSDVSEQGKISAILTLLIISILVFLVFSLNIWLSIAISILMMIIVLFAAIMIFNSYNLLINIFYPLFVIVVGAGLNVTYAYRSESKHKKEIMNAFGKYVSPEVIHDILKNPKKLNLGGERKTISILFSDIRGFTSMSEKLKPEELVSILNEYLSIMTGVILENKGLVDKFIGDAIMALWGTPMPLKNHAELACRSAIEMVKKLKVLNDDFTKRGMHTIDIGIGINTGHAVVGNMGSEQRFDYTAMGDSVNLASRLEGLNKMYNTHILVSEATKTAIPKDIPVRLIDKVKVKGKKEAVKIYEVMAEQNNILSEEFGSALEEYFKGNFKKALKGFESCAKKHDDQTSTVFIERCKECMKNKLKGWSGVWEMKSK